MNLGIFLALGDSFQDMERSGRASQFKQFYLKPFSKSFDKIYIFSYANEKVEGLPKNIKLIPNKYNLHRFLYGTLMPFLTFHQIKSIDVIRAYHLHGTLPAIITKIFFNKPFVFNWAYDYRSFAQIEKRYLQLILIFLVEPLAKIFASKIFIANHLRIEGAKNIYLPNGVDTNFFRPVTKIKNGKPVILSVGRLEKQKHYENLIYAASGVNARLVLVGRGRLRDRLINLAKKQKVDLEIIERVQNSKMPQIYSRADIFVLPSIIEGSPKALLEAMSCELPVIGTKVEGIENIIQDGVNGLLTGTGAKSIKTALQKYLKNSQLRIKLAQKAREFVLTNHDLKTLMRTEISTLKEMK